MQAIVSLGRVSAALERLRSLLDDKDSGDFPSEFRKALFPPGWRRGRSVDTILSVLCPFLTSVSQVDRQMCFEALYELVDEPAHADAACKTDLIRILIDEMCHKPASVEELISESSIEAKLLGKLAAFAISHETAELWLRRTAADGSFTPAALPLLTAFHGAVSRSDEGFIDMHGFSSVSSPADVDSP